MVEETWQITYVVQNE